MEYSVRTVAPYEMGHPGQAVVAALDALGLQAGMRVLDAGCGAGVHLPLMADLVGPGGMVVGLDIDSERVALARELCQPLMTTCAIELRVGDLHETPVDAGSFDLVWSSAVLHHEPAPVETLHHFRSLVRPGGLVAILDGDTGGSFPCLPWPPELEMRLREATLRAQRDEHGGTLDYHFSGYIGRALPRLLRESGLSDVRLYAVTDVDRTPLHPVREGELRDWFNRYFGRRLGDYLAPVDMQRLLTLVDAGSPDDLLSDPDFFLARMSFLAVGHA